MLTTLLVVVSCWVTSVNCDVASTSRRDNVTKPSGEYDGGDAARARAGARAVRVRQCSERLSSVEMCRDVVRYNVTGWPNLLGHDSLVDADRQLRTFSPLIQYGCAKRHLLFFLCAVYVPMCTEKIADVIGPCRPVCEHVRRRCEPLLHNFGFSWPVALDCARFPARNDHALMCMEGPSVDEDNDVRPTSDGVQFTSSTVNGEEQGRATSTSHCLLMYNETACGAPCVTRHRLITVWMAAVATVCLASTLFCAATYVVNRRHVVYSERVTVLMVACSGLYAVSMLAGIVLGPPTSPCRHDDASMVASDCVVVFVMRYYFSSSCATWWVVLNVVCVLMSRLGLTETHVRRLTTWFHAVSWSVPAALVVGVLLSGDVELDGVLGVCRVTRDTLSHVVLVVTPLLVCLVISVTLIVVSLLCRQQSTSEAPTVRAWPALVASVAVAVICECSTAPAAVSIIYPPVVSVITAASMWSGCGQSCSRLVCGRCDEAMDTSTATGIDRQSRHLVRVVTLPHRHRHHHQQHHQQQQLMRQNIRCSHDFNTACHTHRHQQQHLAAK